MAVGAHELLLVVRAQNQMSAALGRVSRDVRRLQNLRDIEARRSAISNRLARNNIQQLQAAQRIQTVISNEGAQRIAHEQAIARNALQQQNIGHRIENLEVRRTSLARAQQNIQIQRLRLYQQETRLENQLAAIEGRRAAINSQIGRLGTQLVRNQNQQQAMQRQAHALETNRMEANLRYLKARRKYESATRSPDVSRTQVSDLHAQQLIARRRLREAQMAVGEIPGRKAALAAQANDIKASVAEQQAALERLKGTETELAQSANILRERHRSLALQLQNLGARTQALAGVESELNTQLGITENELNVINARWEQQKAAMQQAAMQLRILTEEEQQLNAALMEQDALLAQQNSDRIATAARTVSHFGRVMQMTGLVGTAAFAAMAIGAAHFNTEATRAATQTGAIGSSAQVVVNNATRIQKSIIDLMHEIPANQNDLTDALYNIYSSMNTTFGGGTRLLKLFGQVWVAGGMQGNITEVSDALITLGNNWRVSADDMGAWKSLAASTLATVRFGRFTVEQYTQTMNQLAPAFRGTHQSIEEMNGALAFLSRMLPSTGVTAAGIARMMEQLSRFAANPRAGFEDLAKEIQTADGNLRPLNEVLEVIIRRMPELQKSGIQLSNFFKNVSGNQGTIQARRALVNFVQRFSEYKDILKSTSGDQKEFNRSLKAMENSTGVKWAQFVNDMRALALELGTAATPALMIVGEQVRRLANWFNGLSDNTKHTIATVGAFVAVGALLFGTVLTIAGSLAAMIVSFKIISGGRGIGGLTKLFGASSKSMAVASAEGSTMIGVLARLSAATLIISVALVAFKNHWVSLHDAIHLVSTALIAFSTLKAIGMLSRLVKEGTLARNILMTLTKGPWIIAIVVTWTITKTIADKVKELQEMVFKAQGTLVSDKDKPKIVPNLTNEIAEYRRQGKTMAEIHDTLLRKLGGTPFSDAQKEINKKVLTVPEISAPAYRRELTAKAVRTLNDENQKQNDLIASAILLYAQQEKAARAAGGAGAEAAAKAAHGLGVHIKEIAAATKASVDAAKMTDSQFLAQVRKADELKKAFEKTPNPATWRAYHHFLDALTKRSTAEQKKMLNDLLGSFDKTAKKLSDKAFQAAYANVQQLKKIADKTHSFDDLKRYYDAQEKLQNSATQTQLQAAQAITDAQQKQFDKAKDHAQKMKALHEQNLTNAKNMIDQTTNSIQTMLQSSFESYQEQIGTLFQGDFITKSAVVANRQQFGDNLRPGDIMRDLKMQVNQFSNFQNTLKSLGKKGAPQELIDQLSKLGPESRKQVDLLMKLSPDQFQQYIRMFKKGQDEARKAAARDVARQLREWHTYGRKVQLAIINGMRSERPGLENEIRNMVLGLFPGLAKQAHTKPSDAKPSHVENTNYHVTVDKGDSVIGAINKLHIQHRNRKRPLM